MSDEPIPVSAVDIGDDEEKLVLEVLRSGRLAQGPMVERLEELFRDMTGAWPARAKVFITSPAFCGFGLTRWNAWPSSPS